MIVPLTAPGQRKYHDDISDAGVPEQGARQDLSPQTVTRSAAENTKAPVFDRGLSMFH